MLATHRPEPPTAAAGGVATLAEALALAFDGYPLTEWVVRRDEQHEARRRAYFEEFLHHGIEQGHVLCSDDRSAAAIWFAPEGWKAGLDTLVGIQDPVMCLLAQSFPESESC